MKKLFLILIFIFITDNHASASEITGKISTNMKPIINNNGAEDKARKEENNNSGGRSGDGQANAPVVIKNQAGAIPPAMKKEKQKKGKYNNSAEVKVLGVAYANFGEGALVRGLDMRIYVIEKGMKRYIPGIKELAKYAGREILDVDEDTINKYKTVEKKHIDGELIRGFGEEKVYAIKNGTKHHILNLEELKKDYFGLEIFNVSQAELAKY